MISLEALLLLTISSSIPLILASLGGVISERSGVTNIGIEGMILTGAFTAVVTTHFTSSPILGAIGGMVGGGLVALLHAFISITCGGPQAVSATGIILFATGFTSFGNRFIFGRAGTSDTVANMPSTDIFEKVPIIGDFLSNFSPIAYLTIIIAIFVWYLFKHTSLGYRIHSVGENPKVAETLGIDVWRLRYLCVITGGVLAGLAGAYLSVGQLGVFQEEMSAGRGFLALAAVILGGWSPLRTVLACLFFSFFEGLQLQLQTVNWIEVSPVILSAMPYIVCIMVLAFSKGKSKSPTSIGVPYLKRIN